MDQWEQFSQKLNIDYDNALNFINEYRNSQGFKDRLQAHQKQIGKQVYDKGIASPSLTEQTLDLSYYPTTNEVHVNPYDYNINDGRDTAMYHELGHYLDNSMGTRKEVPLEDGRIGYLSTQTHPGAYSGSYPIFKNNIELQKKYNSLSEDEKFSIDNNVITDRNIYKQNHDLYPMEGYADLISLRYELQKNNIYDSIKGNGAFTNMHLDKYKKINPNFRMFKYYSDDDIVTMMNTVADAGYKSQVSYAKKGRKLIPRKKKFI